MAPSHPPSFRLSSLAKRDHQTEKTWWILGGVLGVFLIIGVLAIWVVCFRQRRHKHAQKLKAQRKSNGKYSKLEDKESTDEHEMQSGPKADSAEMERDRSTSGTRQSRPKQYESDKSSLPLEPQRSRGRSVSPAPDAAMLGAQRSRGRSASPAPKVLSIGNEQRELFLPPSSLSRDHSRSRSLARSIEDTFERHKPRLNRGRSDSPASFVLSRNASMLQSRTRSPSPDAKI